MVEITNCVCVGGGGDLLKPNGFIKTQQISSLLSEGQLCEIFLFFISNTFASI